jgi:hypothetical protein
MSAELDACGCCRGIQTKTPRSLENPPGRDSLAYRVGTHGTFKQSMLASLSRLRALDRLSTREDDDTSIALMDAAATVLDVLTFYQERIANEGYLRTATERRSVLELARSIGYELSPGVAASTYLAFELETAPGSPGEVPIPKGTKVQSIPGPGEQAQIFETVEGIDARAQWNALKPQQTRLRYPAFGDMFLYLKGTATNLNQGDAIIIVGSKRLRDPCNDNWEIRWIAAVEPDAAHDRTRVRFNRRLGSRIPYSEPPREGTKVYALRLRAALFGHNAQELKGVAESTGLKEWAEDKFKEGTVEIDLDAVYSRVVAKSWIALARVKHPNAEGTYYAEIYQVKAVGEQTVGQGTDSTGYMPAKVTHLILEKGIENIHRFSRRTATVYGQSEELPLAEAPIVENFEIQPGVTIGLEQNTLTPLGGSRIVLDRLVEGLQKGRSLIVSGKLIRAHVRTKRRVEMRPDDGTDPKPLTQGEALLVLQPPRLSGTKTEWHLRDAEGSEGTVMAARIDLRLTSAAETDPEVTEVVFLADAPTVEEKARTVLDFTRPLAFLYDRATVCIHANVARATHGASKTEVVGSGDGSKGNPAFLLKQKPLTYISASTPSGRESTLEVRINDMLWNEVSSLYGRSSKEQVYITRLDDDGTVHVQFGDGVMGARLPTGVENVKATYRVGTGLAGMLKAGQLSLLLSRPLGLKAVNGPLAPSGAEDPERLDASRQNAPFTVLTLDRVVSLRDYEDFARAFAGVGKAQANWLWDGKRRVVHITLAAFDGGDVDPGSTLYQNLIRSITAASPPRQEVLVSSYTSLQFKLSATLCVDPLYVPEKVEAAVRQTLQVAFSFDRREFGQGVAASEVITVMQGVEGMRFVDLDSLYLTTPGTQTPPSPLTARRACWDDQRKTYRPAELLTLHPYGIGLEVISE